MATLERPPDAVHIAPLGIEDDRISQPAIEYEADRLILLTYLPRTPPLEHVLESLESALTDHGIDYQLREANFDDLFDGLGTIAQTIEDQPDRDDVYVNVSSGNKIAAIAGMIACMATSDAVPYYVTAEEHDSNFPHPSGSGPSTGVRSIEPIPRYPMEAPDTEHLRIMKHIDEQDTTMRDTDEPFATKSELIEFGETAGLAFIADYDGDTPQGKHQRLSRKVLEPLLELAYIRTESHGTADRVFLTPDGKNTLRAFAHKLA